MQNRRDLLEPTDYHTTSPLKGEATYWSIRAGDRVVENAAWTYSDPPADGPAVKEVCGILLERDGHLVRGG